MTGWRTRIIHSFGASNDGDVCHPLASVTVPPPASNVLAPAPLTERVYRALHPEPRVELPFDLGYRDPLWQPPKADEQQPAAVETAETEAPVITPPERDLNAEVGELLAPVFGYLNQFVVVEAPDNFDAGYQNPLSTEKLPQPEKSPEAVEYERRKRALLSELGTWSGSLVQFLTDHRSWRTSELQQQHGEAWRAARQQDAIVAGILAEGSQATANMRRLQEERSKAGLLVDASNESEPDFDSLPSQGDIEKWRAENVSLKAAWKVADEAVSAEISRQRQLRLRYEREVIKRRALRQVERSLRLKLGGEEVKDPGTGLVGAPEL